MAESRDWHMEIKEITGEDGSIQIVCEWTWNGEKNLGAELRFWPQGFATLDEKREGQIPFTMESMKEIETLLLYMKYKQPNRMKEAWSYLREFKEKKPQSAQEIGKASEELKKKWESLL
jgi:hypothetical protein